MTVGVGGVDRIVCEKLMTVRFWTNYKSDYWQLFKISLIIMRPSKFLIDHVGISPFAG
jgi:hypothetical protein